MSSVQEPKRRIIDRILRFPWETNTTPWGGTDDKEVIAKMLDMSGISDACLKPLAKTSVRFNHVTFPSVLMLNNSKNPILAYRNFWRSSPLSPAVQRPDYLGPELTQEEQFSLLRAYNTQHPYRFVFHLAKDHQAVNDLASYMVGIAMLTSYVFCFSTTLERAFKLSIQNESAQVPLEEFEALRRTPMLVLTELNGTQFPFKAFENGYGSLGGLLYDRFHNGRTTVFLDGTVWSDVCAYKKEVLTLPRIVQATNQWPIMKTPLKRFLLDNATRINCDLDRVLNKEVWYVSR